ncbi:MAG TPA: hypothetical protein VFQ61_23330 [Polyangiaceae bacterium]|nr:hypothetical protein [Polyangiaceae bacterium]
MRVRLSFAVSSMLVAACSATDPGAPLGGLAGAAPAGGGNTALSTGGSSSGSGASSGGNASAGAANGGSAGTSTVVSGGKTQGEGGAPSRGGTSSVGGNSGGIGSAQGGAWTGGASQGGSSQAGSSPGGASGSCPSNAAFCSSFEDSAMPAGAVFKLNGDPASPWTVNFEVDTTMAKSGKSSLRVKSANEGGGGAYKMLAVPTGGAAFWVRMYMRSDKDIGEIDHNVFAQAATKTDPNDDPHMEFAEDVGLSLHYNDAEIKWPMGYGRTSSGGTTPYKLVKDTWHCVELFFDGPGKTYRFYANGMEVISANGFPSASPAYSTFKFGYNSLHGTQRKTWYDDVAVGPSRIGCP